MAKADSSWRLLSTLIAMLGAIAAGVSVHYLSLALGLTETVPGVILSTALSAIALNSIRWNFD